MPATKTLLDLVKKVMSDMDSDEITSIDDTVEATQVANTIQDVYDQMVTNEMIPEQRQLRQQSTDPSDKVFIAIDADIKEVMEIRILDAEMVWKTPTFLTPVEFLDLTNRFNIDDDNVEEVGTPAIRIQNDRTPLYWTSFDDDTIVFDSYDTTIDTLGIHKENITLYVTYYPEFELDDDFALPVDDNLVPYLLAEAKATCFVNLKQQTNPKLEAQARRQKVKLQHGRYRTREAEETSLATAQPHFGRGTAR